MKIQLDEKHFLNTDAYCCYISCLVIPKDKSKKPYEIRVGGFHRRLEDAISSFVDSRIRMAGSDVNTLKKLSTEILKIKSDIKKWKINLDHIVEIAGKEEENGGILK